MKQAKNYNGGNLQYTGNTNKTEGNTHRDRKMQNILTKKKGICE